LIMADKCPICKYTIKGYPALSRADNQTKICSSCGTVEALMCAQMSEQGKTREEIKQVLLDDLKGR